MEVMTSLFWAIIVKSFKIFNNRIKAVLKVSIVLFIQRDKYYPDREHTVYDFEKNPWKIKLLASIFPKF